MIDVDVDICCFLNKRCNNIIYSLYQIAYKTIDKNEFNPCPMQGKQNFTDVDLNVFFGQMMPHVFPTGMYKIILAYHNSQNETGLYIELQAYIRAKDIMKMEKMG